jgi:ribonuclease D
MSEPEAQLESTPLNEPRSKVHLVDNTESLATFLKALEVNSKAISIDAERASGFRYGQKAYLIQIGIQDDAIYLLDPIAEFDKGTLDKARQTINLTPWLIHAASQDLICLAEFGLKPINLFDTELAGRLLGLPKVSLGTMTEHYLQLKLAKEHSAVDWSQRPFPQSWLDYAALDVDVLPDLHQHILQDLKDQDKLAIATEEFTALLNFQIKEPKIDRWRGTTGIHEFKEQRELTIVKHVWEAREALAIAKDISPGRLIPDAAIVAAVREKPKSRSELAAMRSFTGRASRTYIDTWWDSYYKGLTTEKLVELRPKATGIPNHRNWPGKFPEANARLQWSKKLLAQLSIAVNIPQENIIAPDVVRTLCFTPPALDSSAIKDELRSLGVRVWQIELVTELLLESLAKAELPPTEEPTV